MYAHTIVRSSLRSRSSLISRLPAVRLPSSCLSFSSSSICNEVIVDQTKKKNKPSEDQTEEHKTNSKTPEKGDPRYHDAIHEDPEHDTDRATGIKTKGQGTPAGQGPPRKVHKETREQPGPHMVWEGKKK